MIQDAPELTSILDVCRRAMLMLPLAHMLNDIPMRGPAQRLPRVVRLLEEAMRMTDGGRYQFRDLIKRSNIPSALKHQLQTRKSGSIAFARALSEDVGRERARGRRQGGSAHV